MGSGKVFCIIGGLAALLGTFLFSFVTAAPGISLYGLGLYLNLIDIFTSGDILGISVTVLFLLFTLAGIFILIGVKSRGLAIVGSLCAIILSVYMLLVIIFTLPIEISQYIFIFLENDIVDGILPLAVPLGNLSLGTYLLLGGGVLGLIGGIIGPD
ncbi:MAG: hypothetical protein ACXADU_12635 [Promethearchaeota archaeon]|jgi:hypothetical protein